MKSHHFPNVFEEEIVKICKDWNHENIFELHKNIMWQLDQAYDSHVTDRMENYIDHDEIPSEQIPFDDETYRFKDDDGNVFMVKILSMDKKGYIWIECDDTRCEDFNHICNVVPHEWFIKLPVEVLEFVRENAIDQSDKDFVEKVLKQVNGND